MNRTIGSISASTGGSFSHGLFQGIERVLRAHGYSHFVLEYNAALIMQHQLARTQACAWIGSIVSGTISELQLGDVPIVNIPSCDPELRCPAVRSDNAGAMRALTTHLIEHGHTRIGFFTVAGNADFIERYAGYQQALEDHGLEVDPQLTFQSRYYDAANAHQEAAAHIARGLHCSAIVSACDSLAMGMMSALQAAGLRVPDDIAVVGFDDSLAAATTNPPLTTVRQDPALLGETAAQTVLDLLSEKPLPTRDIRVPAHIVIRQSCGCRTSAIEALPLLELDLDSEWHTPLARRLVDLLRFPLQLTDADQPTAYWPEVTNFINAFEAALKNEPAPELAILQSTWFSAFPHNEEVIILEIMQRTLDYVAEQLTHNVDQSQRRAMKHVLNSLHTALHSARVQQHLELHASMERFASASNSLARSLFNREQGTVLLDWLSITSTHFACILAWRDDGASAKLVVEQIYNAGVELPIVMGQSFAPNQFPPDAWIDLGWQLGKDSYLELLPITSDTHIWGILVLSGVLTEPFMTRVDPLRTWSTSLAQMFERSEFERRLIAEREEMRQTYDRERMLIATVQELGCPVLPVLPGLLLVPLIGSIDSQRAQLIIDQVLQGVNEHKAHHVLLDMTGVPLVDTHVAGSLIQTASAVKLLGAEVALIGVRPEIAHSIVALGIALSDMRSYPTLAEAVRVLGMGRR